MADTITGPPVPVLAATGSRLVWRALATWVQAAGATLSAVVVAFADNKESIAPLIPIKYAWIGAAVFAAGKVIEAVQHQKDTVRDKPLVNLSGPTDGGNP